MREHLLCIWHVPVSRDFDLSHMHLKELNVQVSVVKEEGDNDSTRPRLLICVAARTTRSGDDDVHPAMGGVKRSDCRFLE